MLQGRRVWAQRPTFVRCSLGQTLSFVEYSARSRPIEYFSQRKLHTQTYTVLPSFGNFQQVLTTGGGRNRSVNLPSIPPPLENTISKSPPFLLWPTVSEKSGLQTKAQCRRTIPHGLWQGRNWVAGRPDALNQPRIAPSDARWFSTVNAMTDSDPIQPTLVEGRNPTVSTGEKPMMLKFESGVVARSSSSSVKKKATPTTESFEWSKANKNPYERKLENRVRDLRQKLKRIQSISKISLKHWASLEKELYNLLGFELPPPPIKESVAVRQVYEKDTFNLKAPKPTPGFDLVEAPILDNLFEDLVCTLEPELPYTPLRYQVAPSALLKRQTLRTGSINNFWSHQLYEDNGKAVNVHYCQTFEQSERIAEIFLKDRVVGFDMEWSPFPPVARSTSPRHQTSLMQIANESDIALFHISLFKGNRFMPPNLQKIIESKDILKTGVNIAGDAKRICQYLHIIPQGLFELSDLQNLVDIAKIGEGRIPRRLVALSKLVEKHLLLPLSKGRVRMSNWSKPLTPQQIRYAASDAYAGLRVFDTLEEVWKGLRPLPPFPQCRVLIETAKTSKLEATETKKIFEKPTTAEIITMGTFESPETVTTTTEHTIDSLEATVETTGEQILLEHLEVESNEQEPYTTQEKKDGPDDLPGDPEIAKADDWVTMYLRQNPKVEKLKSKHLKAYALWHNGGFEVDKIAEHLGSGHEAKTVCAYINLAVKLGGLPCDKAKLKKAKRLSSTMKAASKNKNHNI